ncbi:MAG: hypothetical protein N2235_24860, partial [Fischerella sp.]|nr:hypothetical protein [Fischerella sp.]
ITGTGTVRLGTTPQLNFNLAAKNFAGDAIAQLYNSKPSFSVGTVSGTARLTGSGDNVKTTVKFQAPQAQYPTSGEVIINRDRSFSFGNVVASVAGGKVRAAGSWNQQGWQAVVDASQVQVEHFVNANQLQNISLKDARFNGRLILLGSSTPFKITNIRTQDAKVKVADGTVAVSQIQLGEKSFSTQLVADGVRLGRLFKQSPPALKPVLQGQLAGTFQVSGRTDAFDLKTLHSNGSARLTVGGGTVNAAKIQIANGRYQAQLQAKNVPLQQLAKLPQQFHGNLDGQFKIAGSVESFQLHTIQADGQAQLNLGSGKVKAVNIQLANGGYQVVLDAAGIDLKRFSQQLQGKLAGKAQIAGNLSTFNLADVRAAAQLQFSQGLAGIDRRLTATVSWNGEKLLVERATAPGLNANGYILASTNASGIPEITDLNLNVRTKNYNLKRLPLKLADEVDLAGKADFSGKITGKLPVPNLTGQLTLRDLTVNRFAFESVLAGNVQSPQGKGLNLNVTGKRDKIALNLDTNNYPKSLAVQWQQTAVTGQAQGDNLALKVENFPLQVLNLPVPANTFLGNGNVSGSLSGDFQINQKTLTVAGGMAIAQPQAGRLKGDRLQAQFRYEDGKTTLTDSVFIKGKSRYAFAGTFTPAAAGPQIKGKLTVSQGEIQDVLTTLKLFELEDLQRGTAESNYGNARDLNTVSVGLPDQPLLNQIQRFSEIKTLLAQQQQQRRDASLFPELADLQGTFNGEIAVDNA